MHLLGMAFVHCAYVQTLIKNPTPIISFLHIIKNWLAHIYNVMVPVTEQAAVAVRMCVCVCVAKRRFMLFKCPHTYTHTHSPPSALAASHYQPTCVGLKTIEMHRDIKRLQRKMQFHSEMNIKTALFPAPGNNYGQKKSADGKGKFATGKFERNKW